VLEKQSRINTARNMDLEKESHNLSVLLCSSFLTVSSIDQSSPIQPACLTAAHCYLSSTITLHFSYDFLIYSVTYFLQVLFPPRCPLYAGGASNNPLKFLHCLSTNVSVLSPVNRAKQLACYDFRYSP